MIEKDKMVENLLSSVPSTSESPEAVTVAPSHGSCIKFNQSDPFQIGDKYGGIPLNLLTNLIGWVVLLVLFVFIRRNAVKRLVIRQASTTIDSLVATKWHSHFFGRDNEPSEEVNDGEECDSPQETNVEEDGNLVANPGEEHLTRGNDDLSQEVQSRRSSSSEPRRPKILTFHEKRLQGLMGPDAVQYLRFQKYIIIFILFTTTVSLGVILPLNFQGTQLGNATDFGHTTLANLNPNDDRDSWILWIHVFISFLMFPAAIFLMRRFSIGLKMRDTSLKITRTIAIENIPPLVCTLDQIKEHFRQAYPGFKIDDIQLVYDVSKLIALSRELENVIDAKKFSEAYEMRHKEELKMVPVSGARCCRCFCFPCVNKVNCIEYFTEQEVILREKVKVQSEQALKSPLGMAFVTFNNINHARTVLRDHKNSILNFKFKPPQSKVAIRPDKWRVWYAPPPNDIIWENLSDKRQWVNLKKLVANLFIFLVAFFLTTPQLIVHQLDPILNALKNITGEMNHNKMPNSTTPVWDEIRVLPAWLTDFLPTLAIWSFTAMLPVVVAYADILVGHWTRSGQNHAIMKKTFWYLLFMVIILPTFGFTSAQAYIDFLIKNNQLNWECIFLPDSGAFFVNYVITSAMIGSGLELIRFPELFWYLIQICMSRSKADTPIIRKAIRYEFRFGEQYARMMLIFAMVVMFSVSCPLITPFGCLYFILKHLVDRHNLAFVYERSKINKKVHATAINFVIMSVALLQFFMIIFSVIRSLDTSFSNFALRTKIAILLFFITMNVCSSQIWSNTCRKISPIKYEDVMLANDNAEDEHSQPFLPEVLKQTVLEARQGGEAEQRSQVRRTVSWGAGDGIPRKGYRTF